MEVAYEDLAAGPDTGYDNDPAAASLARELDRKKTSRTLAIPTNDDAVRARLRELGEPITLFGERKEDRRDRLRYLVSQMSAEGAGLLGHASESESEEEDEEFYTEGSLALLEARRTIAKSSLRRAQKRIARQRVEADISLGAILNLRKLVYRELKTFTTYSAEVGDDRPLSCARFAPNSQMLATGGWTGLVKLWDVPSCRPRAVLKGHGADRVGGLAWHPQATLAQSSSAVNLATGASDGNIALWDLDSLTPETTPSAKPEVNARPLGLLKGHQHRICRVAFHPDGRYLGSASFDETWRLWDVEAGTCLLEQEGHSKEVYAIAFQDDGALVCTGGLDAIGRVWDLRTGRTVMVLDSHVKDILAVDFAPNGYQIATGSNDDSMRIWDMRQVGTANYLIAAHTKSVTDLRFYRPTSASMPFPVTAAQSTTTDGLEALDATQDTADGAVEPPLAGTFLASCGHDGMVKLWSADDWQLIKGISVGDDNKVTSVDIAPDGRFLATAEWSRNFRLIAAENLAL